MPKKSIKIRFFITKLKLVVKILYMCYNKVNNEYIICFSGGINMRINILSATKIVFNLDIDEMEEYELTVEDFANAKDNREMQKVMTRRLIHVLEVAKEELQGTEDEDFLDNVAGVNIAIKLNENNTLDMYIKAHKIHSDDDEDEDYEKDYDSPRIYSTNKNTEGIFANHIIPHQEEIETDDDDDDDILDLDEEVDQEEYEASQTELIQALQMLGKLFSGKLSEEEAQAYVEEVENRTKNASRNTKKQTKGNKKTINLFPDVVRTQNPQNKSKEVLSYNLVLDFKKLNDIIGISKALATVKNLTSSLYKINDVYQLILSKDMNKEEYQNFMSVIIEFYQPMDYNKKLFNDTYVLELEEHHKDDVVIKEDAIGKLSIL